MNLTPPRITPMETLHLLMFEYHRGESNIRPRLIVCLRNVAALMDNFILIDSTSGRTAVDRVRRYAEEVYSILNRMEIDFAPGPADYPANYSAQQYRDEMHYFAKKLSAMELAEAPLVPPPGHVTAPDPI